MPPQLALITGASSGVGKELAIIHAKKGGDVILAARREPLLQALKKELEEDYKVKAYVIPADLGQIDGAQKLYDEVKKQKLEVDYLINDAGAGGRGPILNRKVEDDVNTIMVNSVSLMVLTRLFAEDMAARGGGKMLHISSGAGFVPGPNEAVYFASKAFVNSFSQAVDQELRSKGITSTVLCPGSIDTEFAAKCGVEKPPVKGASAASVAKCGYEAMMKGRLVAMNEWVLSLLFNWIAPLLPRRVVLKLMQTLLGGAQD